MSFLPKDYKAPKSTNNYAKLVEGANRFRILSAPILGWEDWLNNKPIRFRYEDKPAKPMDPKKPVRHFWSMIVWNYQDESIQVLHVTQATIRNNIEALTLDEDWGLPYGYDIKITKTGEKTDTEYLINPLPHKPIDPAIIKAFKDKPCNLDAMYTNEDPFGKYDEYTPGVFSSGDSKVDNKSVPLEIVELQKVIDDCSPEFKERLKQLLEIRKNHNLADLPKKTLDKVKEQAFADRDAYADSQKNGSEVPF